MNSPARRHHPAGNHDIIGVDLGGTKTAAGLVVRRWRRIRLHRSDARS